MPCLAEEVLKAPGGQPAFQQLKGATALYCLPAPRLLCRRLAAQYFGGAPPGMLPSPLIGATLGELALRILARLSPDASLLRLQIRTDAPAHRRLWLPSGDRETVHHATCSLRLASPSATTAQPGLQAGVQGVQLGSICHSTTSPLTTWPHSLMATAVGRCPNCRLTAGFLHL